MDVSQSANHKYKHDHLSIYCVIIACFLFSQYRASNGLQETSYDGTCEPIQVAMCNGLVNYNTTKLPNKFGHATQDQVYWALQPWWPFIDAGCSDNLRNFLCGLFLPKCVGNNVEPHYPCAETCKKAKVRCKKQMRMQSFKWSKDFRCGKLLPKDSHRCIKPEREGKKKQNKEYNLCQKNTLPMCQGIPFTFGSLPNAYLQGDQSEIAKEMRQYQALLSTRCSENLKLFLCGVYMPYCIEGPKAHSANNANNELQDVDNKIPFVVPCREMCQEVYDQCSKEYHKLTGGLPWPAKLHCHRFPTSLEYHYKHRTNASTGVNGDRMTCTMPLPN
ncbi:frizzled-4 [Biomphalaria glabrata]|uniref:FZ domain-containing protein n=1 Tax=Biomphalaria glabrata TaxID=6526 RepID=A0A2C9L9G3_BIOGL|nr:frizzled-4 [Biomphalaria glabrata]